MGANCATPAETADDGGPVSEVDRPRHSRRDFVHCTRRLQLASYASRSSTLANGLWLLLALAQPWAVGRDQWSFGAEGAHESGAGTATQCGSNRQPECQNVGRR